MTDEARPDGCDGRRLRFEHVLREDESAPGAVLAALGPQWLDDSRPVLEAAGLAGRRPGTLAILSDDEARRLAWTIRCDPDALAARVGRSPKFRGPVAFDGTELPRCRLETRIRRIAPESFADSLHHRVAWMDRLLPYCPATLERLVDACGSCGAALLWTGVGHLDACGACGRPAAASLNAPLPDALADDYRAFATLSSPIRSMWAAAADGLHPDLAACGPGELTRMAFQLAATLGVSTIGTAMPKSRLRRPTAWGAASAEDLAAACAAGHALLRGWPDSLHESCDRAAFGLAGDQAAYDRLRAKLKRMVADDQPEATRSLLASAMPDLQRHAAHAFAGPRPYYIARTAHQRLGVKAGEMASLRRWPDLIFRSLPGRSRVIGQYDAAQIDEIADALRGAGTIREAAWKLGLPVHGAEQLADLGMLRHQRHGGALALGRLDLVTERSVEKLRSGLGSVLRNDAPPPGAVPLRSAACVLGGAPKPWGAIVAALLDGGLRTWADAASPDLVGGPRVPSLLVDPDEASATLAALARCFPPPGTMPRSTDASMQEAADVLNVLPKHVEEVAGAFGVRFVRIGRRLAAGLDGIRGAAAAFVSLMELRHRTGGTTAAVRRLAAEAGAEALPSGFARAPLAAAGVLQPALLAGRGAACAARPVAAAPRSVTSAA